MIQLIGAQNMMVEHSLHPPPSFLKEGGGRVNFDYFPWRRGESEKFKKGWKYHAGADLLKRRGPGTFPICFFQGLSFLHLEIILPFAELCHAFEEKKNFFLPP